MTSSGGASKFKILLSKKTTFWIKGILKFNPGFNIIFLGSPNCSTIAWLISFTTKIEKNANTNITITLFHGLKDDVVPLIFSKKILKIFPKARKKLIKIKNGEHSLSKKKDLKKICKELSQMIPDHV